MNTTMEMLTYVKGLTELTDKQRSELIMNLINESKNTKHTVITKTAPAPAKAAKAAPEKLTFYERMQAAKAAKAAAAPDKAKAKAKAAAAPDKAKAKAKAAKAAAAPAGKIEIINYSEKAFAVIGDTKPIKDVLKSLGGRFNAFLKVKGETVPGWIFGIKHLSDVTAALQ